MTSGMTTKVRLVRCPKCRQLLPELPGHTLFKCGGCDTILQAKIRKNDVKSGEIGLHETDAARTNALDLVTEDKESSYSSHKDIVPSSGECSLDQNNERDQRQSGDGNSEQLGDINLSNEDQNSEQDESHSRDSKDEKLGAELVPHGIEESSAMARANSEVKENGEVLPLAGANLEVGTNEGDSNFRSLSTDNIVATTGSTSIVTHHEPARESFRVFDRVRSTDTIETAEFATPSSEFSGRFGEMFKSPTTRSYYAYEGSVSSYDGTDDQFPEHQMHSSRRNDKVANFSLSEERQKKDKFLVNSMMDRKHLVSKGVFSPTKKYSANKRNKMHQDELLEPTTNGRPERNWRRHERENYPSRVPFYGMDSLSGYEDGGPSNQVHNQFHRNSSFQSSDRSDYLGQDKTKLLQIVSELQDEINKRCYLNGRANGRVSPWEEKHIPAYYDHEAPEGAFRNDLINPRFPGRGRPGSSWLQQCNFSHIPFSGEATSSRLEAHHSCLHCHPQDWQCSAQLPPPSTLFHNKGLCRLHSGNNFYNSSYGSLPSSPQRYVNSEFPIRTREAKSEEQRHKDHEVKKYHLAKRHLRPIAGGAPFITCYNCSTSLQLPADFLLFRKRFHRLRCSACSELLKFSLQNRTHLVPFAAPNAMDPPPSEVDDYSDAINRRLVSASHVIASPYADPVSCSDDYGLSYCKSCSTEGDPLPSTSFHTLQGNVDERNMLSDPFKPMGVRQESVLKQSHNKYKNFVERYESAGPSSNTSKAEIPSSSEIEPRSSSPLHRLMGYSSPSQVINGYGPSGTGARSRR
ncbi:hypothetical protein SLA2020_316560 [Shorea laevis]